MGSDLSSKASQRQVLRLAEARHGFALELGGHLPVLEVAVETYGTLSAAKDNAVLICHALAADAHVARHPEEAEPSGWWDDVVGPGKAIDTDRFFVVCPNILGSCHGTTGPASIEPESGRPYGARFPRITVGDWVAAHILLVEALGIERLFAAVGGSIGGQQALELAIRFPERVGRVAIVAAAARLSTQGLAFNACGRASIVNDPLFQGGDFYASTRPTTGLSVARMMAHITYLSDEGMRGTFGRRPRMPEDDSPMAETTEFAVADFIAEHGRRFAEDFDANSYLAITRAMDHYDAAVWGQGDLGRACARLQARVLLLSFDSDWLYPPKDCRELALALIRAGKQVHYANLPAPHGHDSFLLGAPRMNAFIQTFLTSECHAAT